MPVQINTVIVHRWPVEEHAHSVLSFDHAQINGAAKMDQVTHLRGYSPYALRDAGDHLRVLEANGEIDRDQFVIVESARNLVNNPRCVAWTRAHGLCQEQSERAESTERPYWGLSHTMDGGFRADRMDFRAPVPDDVRFFVSGIPVLWDGRVLTLDEMAPEVSDFAHLWDQARGDDGYRRLKKVFSRYRYAPAEDASKALIQAAHGLPRSRAYLQHVIGTGNGHFTSLIAIGSLEDLGTLAKLAGATNAIVVDNGGSVNLGLRRPGQPLRNTFESWYHRTPAICVLAHQIVTPDPTRVPFVGSPCQLGRMV